MDDDTTIRFVGVHPRPPEPIRDNHATARDAELTLWGTELEDEKGPVIIGGDLNDVAWSKTTRLFLRTSGLLDPRRGRGFFNSFHADRWYMRFPLDHIFHSPHFTISKLARLEFVGSDHFPILIDLHYTAPQADEHQVLQNKQSDAQEIELRVQRAVDNIELQGEAVDEGRRESIDELDRTR
jgi:endonuclease/exonuclease/phosphatase (EEP) superfamily protein YafD